MHLKAAVLILAVISVTVVSAKVYDSKCRLAADLIKNKFTKTYLKNWVCLINRVSGMNTSAYKEVSYREKYFGLFQIGLDWCKEGRKGGKCNIACESFLDDNIKDDSACALKIREEVGFKYWKEFSKCSGILEYPDLEKCPDLRFTYSSSLKRRKRNLWTISNYNSPLIVT